MALGTSPSQARAVAVFNPTAPALGFLQPLLVGVGGDNRSFVQLFSAPDRLAGFAEVAWPDRDFIGMSNEPLLEIGGEPLWGFLFPDEQPLVALWSNFRETMRERIDDPRLADKPLQLFDSVDTLDFDEFKPVVYGRAYRAYAEMGREAADRWRDRSILEPALAGILPALGFRQHRTTVLDGPGRESGTALPRLRARIADGEVQVFLEGVGEHQAIIVALSTSATPLIRDLEFQAQTDLPTVTFFAPYATSTLRGRDPVVPIRPLLETLRQEAASRTASDVRHLFRAQHYMLLREPIWAEQTSVEVSCRLAARALKAGAVTGGAARLYS